MATHDFPSFDSPLFDPRITSVPDAATSRKLAMGFVEWVDWTIEELRIRHAKIFLEIHQGSLTNVQMHLLDDFGAFSYKRYDKPATVKRLQQLGKLRDAQVATVRSEYMTACVFEVFSVVLRLSDHNFGYIQLTVKGGKLHEVVSSRATRCGKAKWVEQLAQAIYPPAHLDQGL